MSSALKKHLGLRCGMIKNLSAPRRLARGCQERRHSVRNRPLVFSQLLQDSADATLMTIQHERLAAIIEFAQHSARLSTKPVASVSQHNSFVLHEEKAQGRPGLHFNQTDDVAGLEVWLSVDRLHETHPPECTNELLKPWLASSQGPEEPPSLRASAPVLQLEQAEKNASSKSRPLSPQPQQGAPSAVMLESYPRRDEVRTAYQRYTDSLWRPWAEEEKKRREIIRLYAHLFTLRQQLEGGLVETPTELVWGVGIGIWKTGDVSIQYPILTQAVEVSLNQVTSAIEILPRDTEPRLETDSAIEEPLNWSCLSVG